MQSHPSISTLQRGVAGPLSRFQYPRLAELVRKYPKSAGALFQTFNDVTLAQKWADVQVLELEKCERGAIKGLRPSLTAGEPPSTCVVVPCALAEVLSTSWVRDAFAALDRQLADAPESLFMAICSEDSSIVYYKITKGITKPEV